VSLKRFINQSMKFSLMILVAALKGDQFFFGLKVKNQLMELLTCSNLFQDFFAVMFEAVVADKCLLNGVVLLSNKFADGKG